MKNIIKQITWITLLLLAVAACSPQELDKYSLSDVAVLTDSDISFTFSFSHQCKHTYLHQHYRLPSSGVYTIRWIWEMVTGNKRQ